VGTLVSYQVTGSVATITMDDGKVNALSPRMLGELNQALDRAAADRAVVVLGGREGVLSAGFDLQVLRAGGADALGMVRSGFQTAERLLSFPTPVVIACTGHAVAMGAFLLLSGDYRVGASGSFMFQANEVALGITMPHAAVEILRQRLIPAYFNRATLLAEPFPLEVAEQAGFLDRVVEEDQVWGVAHATAEAAAKLDLTAHAASKLRARAPALAALRQAIEADEAAARTRV
jgi:enoyl-CoA hydratase